MLGSLRFTTQIHNLGCFICTCGIRIYSRILLNVNIAFVLHLYQPITQEGGFFNAIYSSCYSPLLKLIKNKKDFHVTLNTPLSLLQQMDSYGHSDWIDLLKELINAGKVEITGSAAYHPLLTKIPNNIVEEQIILNEYGLGYYLGRRNGFEGEPSILVKNLCGFFPPELAVNSSLVKTLAELGYSWVIADEPSVTSGPGIHEISQENVKLIIRNRDLSNTISFKRDSNIRDFSNMLNGDKIVVLDGETFGHHNVEGLLLLENIVNHVHYLNGDLVSVSSFIDKVDNSTQLNSIEDIKESSWGTSDGEVLAGNVYPMWDNPGNKLHEALWKLQRDFIATFDNYFSEEEEVKDCENTPVWKEFPNKDIQAKILFMQALSSDQFWWASHKIMPDGTVLYNENMVKRSLSIYRNLLSLCPSDSNNKIEQDIVKVEELFGVSSTKLY